MLLRICGLVGHIARNCSQAVSADPAAAAAAPPRAKRGGGGSLAGKRCFNCGKNGHLSADCTIPAGNTACYTCGGQGHKSNACPSK